MMKLKDIAIVDEEVEVPFFEKNRLALIGMILPFLALALIALVAYCINRFSKKKHVSNEIPLAKREENDGSGRDKMFAFLR